MATVASYPKVDLEYAATLTPSKLNGKRLMFMVNVVAGVGVSLDALHTRRRSALTYSSSYSATIKASCLASWI